MNCTPKGLLQASAGWRDVPAKNRKAVGLKQIEEWTGPTPPGPPAIPVATAATGATTTSFTANWAAAALASSYRLDVSESDVFASYVAGYQDKTVSGLSDSVTGLTPATTYYYRVRAVNGTGTSGNSNTITAQTAIDTVVCQSIVTNGGGDTFDCYAVADPVTSLPNAGTAFSGLWIIGDSPLFPRYDTFDTYTVASPTTQTLDAGVGFSAAWIYGDGKVPYGDTFESYTVADPTAETLNGGTGSSVAWEYGDATVAFSYGDTFESYTVADPTTATLNGGTGSSAAWEYGDATTMTYLGDSFDTYTVGAAGTLNDGTGFSGAWIYA